MYHDGMKPHCERIGERAWLLQLGESIDPTTSVRVCRAHDLLRNADLALVEDMLPAYASILLRVAVGASGTQVYAVCQRACDIVGGMDETPGGASGALHRIAVCYDDACAPDIGEVARVTGLSPEAIVRLHCAVEYRVAMIGFAPGFAYLLGMDPRLNVPRRAQPRTRVPAGSVAIGGAQTGIYPRDLPGGWNLIGRTPLTMFDPADAHHPCRLTAGDRVRFEAVDTVTFGRMQQAAQGD